MQTRARATGQDDAFAVDGFVDDSGLGFVGCQLVGRSGFRQKSSLLRKSGDSHYVPVSAAK